MPGPMLNFGRMVIVISIGDCLQDPEDEYAFFLKKIFHQWVGIYPGHTYYILTTSPVVPDDFPSGSNIHVLSYPGRKGLFHKWLIRNRLASLIKKVNAEVLFSFDGSHTSKNIDQCLVIPVVVTGKKLNRKGMGMAKSVIVLSGTDKAKLIEIPIAGEKITVVYGAAKETICPIADEEKAHIKEKYTEGCEFFIYKGLIAPQANIIPLLKAFSLFQKRQKTSMKLVIAGQNKWPVAEWEQLLSTYKYRDDIVMADKMEQYEQEQLFCSAYAFVYTGPQRHMITSGLDAMNCGIPILTDKNLPLKEIANDAVLYFDVADVADIANKMMQIYKDEALRSRLIHHAKTIAATFTWQQAATTIWQSMYLPENN